MILPSSLTTLPCNPSSILFDGSSTHLSWPSPFPTWNDSIISCTLWNRTVSDYVSLHRFYFLLLASDWIDGLLYIPPPVGDRLGSGWHGRNLLDMCLLNARSISHVAQPKIRYPPFYVKRFRAAFRAREKERMEKLVDHSRTKKTSSEV